MDNHLLVCKSLLVLLLLAAARDSTGYPGGAPNTHKMCRNLHPHHKGSRSQKSPSPFLVTVEKSKIPIGSPVNVTITGHPGLPYKGFVMQVRSVKGGNKALGSFTITDPKISKTILCFSWKDSTVTHNSPVLKNLTRFVWTPPKYFTGDVIFRATIVQNFSTFWTNVTAKLQVGSLNGTNPGTNPELEEELATSSSEEDYEYNDNELFHLNGSIYNECGWTKVCFGIPDNCVATRSCIALATVKAQESKYEFEMIGSGYVAVSLSENGDVNIDSVRECMLVDGAVVKFYQQRYEPTSGYFRQSSSNDLELLNSSYWDGMVYCKFVSNEKVELNGVRYDFKTKKYYILLASENNVTEKSTNETYLDNVKFHATQQNNYLSNVSGFCPPSRKILLFNNNKYLTSNHGIERLILDFVFGVFYFIFNVV